MLKPLPLPNPSREGSRVTISLGDVRRASATEEELLNAPMRGFGGSKDNTYDIITHSNGQPSLGRWFGG